jgi:hypothetical protein
MAYVKPQVLVFQEFNIVPTEITEPLRAHIAGPNAVLHRYSVATEKAGSLLGSYDYLNDACYPWPGRLAGSLVDDSYTKLHVDNALLMYYEHNISDTSTTIAPVANQSHWIAANNVSFKSNTSAYPRSAAFKDRDVKVGDVAYLRAVSESCDELELWTEVVGFASDPTDSLIKDATADDANQATTSATTTVTKLAGASNCVTVTANGTSYSGLASGHVVETYYIEVVKSSVAGCNSAVLRVKTASGTDEVAEVTAAAMSSPTTIGTRGLQVTFAVSALTTGEGASACAAAAASAGVAADQLVVGQKWSVYVRQAYSATTAVSTAAGDNTVDGDGIHGAYTGVKNDIYVVEVTKGGLWAALPQITVRTVKGLDFSGPTEVTDEETAVNVGTRGVQIEFGGAGLRKGDKWYITVTASAAGEVRRLILRDDLPADMQEAETLDLKLFIKDNIQVSRNRLGYAPLTNYYTEATQLCVQEGMVAYHPEWTDSGVEQPLPVRGGTLYIEYREWLDTLADEVNSISDVANIGDIPGALDPDNPLKWGVYKALSNSNGTVVKYTAVANPDSLDSWAGVLERIKGRDDMYNLVPMTFNSAVHNLWAAHIGAESNEYANNWKAGFVALKAVPSVKVVGEGVAIGGVSGNVVTGTVLATLGDDPNATGTQYTKLTVTSGNGHFVTNGVQAGDIVRYNFSVDSFGEAQYEEYVVDSVLSETSLLLYTGADAAVTVAQQVEVYHNRNRNEIADDVAAQAGALSNRRVCAVWPDQVGEAGTLQPGYYLAAALAGLASGVVPHQPLTNVEVAGFDDYTRSYKYFNETQLNRMAEAGVWIVTEDNSGTPYTRHALTTDNLDLNRREEMIRRNVDSISYLFLRRLRPFIGRTNATESMVARLRLEVDDVIRYLKTNNRTQELGAQLIDGTVRTLRIHPLLKDRIEIVLDLVVPAPLNNIEVHLVV